MPRPCREWAGASLVLLPFRRSFDLKIGQVLSVETRAPSLPERSPERVSRRHAEGDASGTDDPHSSPSDPARDTASVRELAASFEKIRLTCDFTVSGEIWRVRAIRLLEKPWLIIARMSRSRAVSVLPARLLDGADGSAAGADSRRESRLPA